MTNFFEISIGNAAGNRLGIGRLTTQLARYAPCHPTAHRYREGNQQQHDTYHPDHGSLVDLPGLLHRGLGRLATLGHQGVHDFFNLAGFINQTCVFRRNVRALLHERQWLLLGAEHDF
jgi:hypothetical protein